MIQYLHWYHEDIYGEKRLLKTSKNSNDPYLHTIRSLEDTDLGREGVILSATFSLIPPNGLTMYCFFKAL